YRYEEGIDVLRAVRISTEPARRRLVEGRRELGRGKVVEASSCLVIHEPARQHLWIVVLVRGKPVARHCCLRDWSRLGLRGQDDGIVDHLAGRAELHRTVRIAFARGKGITQRYNEKILDHDILF